MELRDIRAVLPPKPEPKHRVVEVVTHFAVMEGKRGKASLIPTRDQAERIAAIYNEEVGELPALPPARGLHP